MTADSRKEFESLLATALKDICIAGADVKASKNKVRFRNKDGFSGQIYIQHLSKAGGYYAGIDISSCNTMNFCLDQKPPYASRLLNGSFLSQSSLSEKDKRFGDESGGVLRAPSLADAPSTVEKARDRLTKFYLPIVEHCISASPELICDIVGSPDDYAYPFLSALYAAHVNQLAFDSAEFRQVIDCRRIFGDRHFDLDLAGRLLAND